MSVLRCAHAQASARQLSYQELAFHLIGLTSSIIAPLARAAGCSLVPVVQVASCKRRSCRDQRPDLGAGSIAVYWPAASVSPRSRTAHAAVCLDSTCSTEAMIHEPSEASLALVRRSMPASWCACWTLAGDLPQVPAIAWHNHSRSGQAACPGHRSLPQADQADDAVSRPDLPSPAIDRWAICVHAAARVSAAALCRHARSMAWLASVGSWLPLVEQVIEQTERRVLKGETHAGG